MQLIQWLFRKTNLSNFDCMCLIIVQALAISLSAWLYLFLFPLLVFSVAVERNLNRFGVLEQENDNDSTRLF